MNKLEHKLLATQHALQSNHKGEYEQKRLEHSFTKAWKRYVKQYSIPYNPALLSEMRNTKRLGLRCYL